MTLLNIVKKNKKKKQTSWSKQSGITWSVAVRCFVMLLKKLLINNLFNNIYIKVFKNLTLK